jgi:hypothetical protein
MSYPIEIHLHDQDGYVDTIDTFRTEIEAVRAMPVHIAEAQKNPADYATCHFLIVRHEVDGMQEWHEPIEKFPIFA